MDKFDRIYCLHHLLEHRRHPVSMETLCAEMECSQPTVKRLIREMRLYLGAPILNRRGRGYFYDRQQGFELPGMWFSTAELESLLILQTALSQIGPGLLESELMPVRRRVESLLTRLSPAASREVERIRVLATARRGRGLAHLPLVASALLERNRLRFRYHARSSNEEHQREVSPQRLVFYRDNWYLDAFCHGRDALRTFSLDRMREVGRLNVRTHEVDEHKLDGHLASAYGIFAGKADKTAVLRFSAHAARWVADEQWHPKQKSSWLEDGHFELHIPYGDATELMLDICRYGPDVEVVAPPSLRNAVAERLRQAAAQYD